MDIASLRKMVIAAHEEFHQATAFHEVWKPAAYDTDLHSRMGRSYASKAFLVVRTALRREMLLALCRLWDKDNRALRIHYVVETVCRDGIETLAADRAKLYPDMVDMMRTDLQAKADEVSKLVLKYFEKNSPKGVLKSLLNLRHEQLAHRKLGTITGADQIDEEIEAFYQDNAAIVAKLLSLVNATAYEPLEAAKAYQLYADKFWAGARGERTEGHPHFKPMPKDRIVLPADPADPEDFDVTAEAMKLAQKVRMLRRTLGLSDAECRALFYDPAKVAELTAHAEKLADEGGGPGCN